MAATNRYTRNWGPDYCILDVETTGLSPQRDELLEIGLIRVRGHEIAARYSQLVQPVGKIPQAITQKTGITEEMVSSAPSPKAVQAEILAFIGTDTILGHNTSFDIGFLNAAFGVELPNKYMDTLPIARRVFPDAPGHGLSDLTEYLELVPNEHRALADCVSTKALYDFIRQLLDREGYTVQDLFRPADPWAGKHIDVKQIQPTNEEPDENSFFFCKHVVFSGDLARYTRKEAMQLIVNLGGELDSSVTRKTNVLVLGDLEQATGGEKSSKQKRAEALMEKGQDIQIIKETEFYKLLEN